MVFESVNQITNAKNLEDKHKIELSYLQDKMRTLLIDHKDYEDQFAKLVKEKDRQRDDARDQFEGRVKIEKSYFNF